METPERIYDSISERDLLALKDFGIREHEEFFKRNSYLKKDFYRSLAGICLCQGAALHYLNQKTGIKDFDVWHFYANNENVTLRCRRPKRIKNAYMGRDIDFLKRAIPKNIFALFPNNLEKIIMSFLLERNTKSKNLLLKKAVIGLYPNNIFAKILWKGDS